MNTIREEIMISSTSNSNMSRERTTTSLVKILTEEAEVADREVPPTEVAMVTLHHTILIKDISSSSSSMSIK